MNALLLCSLSQFGFAANTTKPTSCPSVPALQAIGSIDTVKENDQWYGAVKSNNFGTQDQWTFAIGSFSATDENDAKQQALNAISSLTFITGPVAFNVEGQDRWVCLYKDSSGHTAGTITPVMPTFRSWIIHR